MLSLAILASKSSTCSDLEGLADACGLFTPAIQIAPLPSIPEVLRVLRTHNPDVILLDVTNWDGVSILAAKIKETQLKGVVIGFGYQWTRAEQLEFEAADIFHLLHAPYLASQLETKVYDALHRKAPSENPNLLAFLPAKAGSGASTVALHTAASLAAGGAKKVLLIEADRRSGVLSILLNLKDQSGLTEALAQIGEMTALEWNRFVVTIANFHILPANPMRRGPMTKWVEYYQLLRFARNRYDYIVIDLPEVINSATTELVRSARATFITCTGEIPSLALAGLRSSELDESEISKDRIKILVNRHERNSLSLDDIERLLGCGVFATLPNDYREIKRAILESRLVSSSSAFAKGCSELSQKIATMGHAAPTPSRFALLRKLSALTGIVA